MSTELLDPELKVFKTVGYEKYAQAIQHNRGVLHFPGTYSDDPNYVNFLAALSDRLEEVMPASETEGGLLTAPFSPGGWTRLRNLSGFKMDPMGVPRVGFVPKSKTWAKAIHRDAFEEIIRLWFRKVPWKPVAVKINKFSSTGPPHWSYDPKLKIHSFLKFIAHADKIRTLADNAQWVELGTELDIWMLSSITRRFMSTDPVTKKGGKFQAKARDVMTFEGREIKADKSTIFPDMFAQRTRLAVAFSNSSSTFQQAILAGYRTSALQHPVWHHTTPTQMAAKLDPYPYLVAGDVTKFDQNMPSFLVNRIFDELNEDWTEGVSKMARAGVTCPFCVNEDRVNGSGRVKWLGNPHDINTYNQEYAFPSGVPSVADVGKIIGFHLDIVPLLDLGTIKLDEIESVANCAHDRVIVLNMGDDFLVGFKEERDYNLYIDYMETGKHPYFDIDLETPASFIGYLVCKDRGKVVLIPNILSYPLNTLSRERGINSRFSPHWAYGYKMKKIHFSISPLFYEVDRIMQDTARQYLGKTIDQLVPEESAPAGMDVRSYFDQVFSVNPDAIHYKITPEQVSPDLLEQIFINIPSKEVARMTEKWKRRG
jgi:hypothetical protein